MYFKNNSTIFKTKQDLTTGKTSIRPTGFGGMFTGGFWKKESIISANDITAIEKYNEVLTDTGDKTKAFDSTMGNASKAAQNLVKSTNGVVDTVNGIPKASRAAAVGMKALSTAMNIVTNIAISMAISYLISGIMKMIGAYDEMSQQAADATAKYKEQSSSIEDYKGKITELKTELASENLTYTEARDKRSQLLDIQKQLIDTYGAEAKGIDLVNGSLDDQVEKLDKLNKQKRQQWENEVNKQSAGQWWQKWGGYLGLALLDTVTFDWSFYDANKWLEDFDNTTNIERITKKVENFKKSINLNALEIETEELEALKTQMDSYEGVSFKGNKMTIAGDAKTVAETVTKIQTEVIGSREDLQGLNQDLKDVYNSAKKIVDANWDTYNTALQNQILDDKTGLEYYGKLTEAYETYQEAVKDGDENTINEAKEGYAKILSDIAGSDMSDSFKKFFENMYPDISDIVDDWKFEVDIVPKINTNKDGLKDDIETVKGLTTEEISAAFENNGTGVTKDQWKAITDLNAEAQANGLDLTTFLEQLREAGYLVSQLDKDIEKAVNDTKNKYGDGVDWGKYFKDNSIDTQEEIDKWNEVTNGIDSAEDAINAYTEATKNANEMTVSLSELEGASDKIKSLGSAFKELSDNGYITTKTLDEMKEATGLADDEWEEYEARLLSAKKGSSDFNQIMSDLTYKILDATFKKNGLVDATEEEIIAVLRENNVLNAEAVARSYLANSMSSEESARAKAIISKYDLNNLTEESVNSLLAEAEAENLAKNKMIQLTASTIAFNNTGLDTSTKVKQLKELALYAGVASEAQLAALDPNILGRRIGNQGGSVVDYVYNKLFGSITGGITFTAPKYTNPSSSGSDKNKPTYEDPTDAIINRINLRSKELEQQEEEIQNLIEIAELENDYKKQISLTNDLIETRKKRVDELNSANAGLHQMAEDLRNGTPQWKEEEWFNSQGQATEAYNTLYNNSSTEEQEKIKDQFEKISKIKEAWVENDKELVELNKQLLQDAETLNELYSSQHENTIRDIEHARDMVLEANPFTDITSYYKQMQEEYHKEAERLRALDPEKYKEEIQELQQSWWDSQNAIVDWRWENSQNWINQRNAYNDWELFGDSEMQAWERVVKWLKEEYPNELDKIREAEQSLFEARKEEFNKANNFASSYINSQKNLLQSYFDATNSIAEAQHEINKELEASKTMYEYLDEETRKLLFNQEDYNALSKELIDIQSEADRLKRQYKYDLNNSTLDTIEEITSNYEMQYEMLMKSYEIAKADLEIAKKKAKLNNVLNERNVRMFINGQWQWVANTQEVINAQSELADAEWAKKVADAGLNQTEAMNELSERTNHLTTTINKFESGVITLGDAIQEVYEIFAYQLPYYVEESFSKINYPASKRNLSIGASSYNSKTGETLVRLNESQFLIKKDSHASGTKKAKPGLADINEILPEGLMTNDGRFIPMANLSGGEMIFNHKMMENLWRQSQVPWNAFTPSFPSLVDRTQTIDKHQDNRIIINGMTVDSGSADGQALISALRRYVGNH